MAQSSFDPGRLEWWEVEDEQHLWDLHPDGTGGEHEVREPSAISPRSAT